MLGLTVATFTIAVACATLSYYLVERPILRYKDRPFKRRRQRRLHAATQRS
jgi:peptidoglycan/LPS O-acetylase OafA/YrhL